MDVSKLEYRMKWAIERTGFEFDLPQTAFEADKLNEEKDWPESSNFFGRYSDLLWIAENSESYEEAEFLADTTYTLLTSGRELRKDSELWAEEVNEILEDIMTTDKIEEISYPPDSEQDSEFYEEIRKSATDMRNAPVSSETERLIDGYIKKYFGDNTSI